MKEYKCNASRDVDEDEVEKKDKDKDNNNEEPKAKEPKEPKDSTDKEKKHRNPRNGAKMKICGNTFLFPIEERGISAPYFTPEVDEKGVCKCVINSSHNYYKNHLHGISRYAWRDPIKMMIAEWLSVFGKGEPDEEDLIEYMRGLQSRSDELQKLYKENVVEVYDEYDETD